MKKIFFIIALSVILPTSFFAQSKTESQNIFAKSYDNVNDFEKILDLKQVQALNTTLKTSEAKTGIKIIIITTSSISPYSDLSDYSLELDKYLTSKLKIDASIIIIMSKKMRQIQVRGVDKLRNKLNDREIENIVSAYVIPELKKGDYYKGLQEGSNQITKKLE